MKKIKHQWDTYYNPRNGRVNIQACSICGVVKGFETKGGRCLFNATNLENLRLKGWTTLNKRAEKRSGGMFWSNAIVIEQ